MNFFSNFTWAVPKAFSDAVASCRFEEGDMLYDTPKAYEVDWEDAIKCTTHFLQVKFTAHAVPVEGKKSVGYLESIGIRKCESNSTKTKRR